MCLLWTQRTRLPTKVSFKGGSPPSIPNPSFFLASPNLGARFLLRVVVCHIPKIWNVKIKKNRNHVCLNWFKFHKELKLFALLKSLRGKTISNLLLFLEELFWGNRISKYYYCIYSNTMRAHLQRKYFTKWFIKFSMPKECLKINFKNYFYKVYSLNLKGLFSNHFLLCK
jgi:hypothetical protein